MLALCKFGFFKQLGQQFKHWGQQQVNSGAHDIGIGVVVAQNQWISCCVNQGGFPLSVEIIIFDSCFDPI